MVFGMRSGAKNRVFQATYVKQLVDRLVNRSTIWSYGFSELSTEAPP